MKLSKPRLRLTQPLFLLMTLLLLWSPALKAQERSSASVEKPSQTSQSKVVCYADQPTLCSAPVEQGEPSPLAGVVSTLPMVRDLKAKLDEAVAKLEEEERYCEDRLRIERGASAAKLAISEQAAKDREALIQRALDTERKRTLDAIDAYESEKAAHMLWLAGGVGVGALAGLAAAGGAVLYFSFK